MVAIYKAQKNSNVFEYVKARVLNSNLDYFLENGVSDLLKQLTEPLDTDYLVLWDSGIIELSTSSIFYQSNNTSMFKNSISGRQDIKGIRKNSRFFKENKEVLKKIEHKVVELSKPVKKERSKFFFGAVYDGFTSTSNVEKYYFFNDNAYVAIKESDQVPNDTLGDLEEIKLSEFYLLYEKEQAQLAS